jgi:hypothetical protein
MTADTDPLIQKLDRVVNEVLAYFAGPGRTNAARVDRWRARDVLQHFLYFHDATAWGIESTAMGGPVWLLPGDADTISSPSSASRTAGSSPPPAGPPISTGRASGARTARR